MNSFNNKDIVFSQLFEITLIFPLTGHKIELWKFHPLSCKEFTHIMIELFNINRLKTFKVIIAIWLSWSFFPVHKIIIYCNGMWCQTMCTKLNGKSMGKCCFTG